MNKDSVKENLWMVGVLIMIAGAFLIGLPLLGGERLDFVRNLSPYFAGFFIGGLIAIDFGFLFAIISLYAREKEEEKTK